MAENVFSSSLAFVTMEKHYCQIEEKKTSDDETLLTSRKRGRYNKNSTLGGCLKLICLFLGVVTVAMLCIRSKLSKVQSVETSLNLVTSEQDRIGKSNTNLSSISTAQPFFERIVQFVMNPFKTSTLNENFEDIHGFPHFKTAIPIFYINRDDDLFRRMHMNITFGQAGLLKRVSAVLPDDQKVKQFIMAYDKKSFVADDVDPVTLDPTDEDDLKQSMDQNLRMTQYNVSRLLSHLKAMLTAYNYLSSNMHKARNLNSAEVSDSVLIMESNVWSVLAAYWYIDIDDLVRRANKLFGDSWDILRLQYSFFNASEKQRAILDWRWNIYDLFRDSDTFGMKGMGAYIVNRRSMEAVINEYCDKVTQEFKIDYVDSLTSFLTPETAIANIFTNSKMVMPPLFSKWLTKDVEFMQKHEVVMDGTVDNLNEILPPKGNRNVEETSNMTRGVVDCNVLAKEICSKSNIGNDSCSTCRFTLSDRDLQFMNNTLLQDYENLLDSLQWNLESFEFHLLHYVRDGDYDFFDSGNPENISQYEPHELDLIFPLIKWQTRIYSK